MLTNGSTLNKRLRSFEQSMIALFDNRVYVNSQHTVWLDPNVSWELLSREGFNIIDFHWIDTMYLQTSF